MESYTQGGEESTNAKQSVFSSNNQHPQVYETADFYPLNEEGNMYNQYLQDKRFTLQQQEF